MKYFIKKNKKPFIISVVVMLIAICLKVFLFSGNIYDESRFEYDSLTFDATINGNGDMYVKETFEVSFNDDMHGLTRDLVTAKDRDRYTSILDKSSVKAYILDEFGNPLPENDYIISTSYNHDFYPDDHTTRVTFPSDYNTVGESIDFYVPKGMGDKKFLVLEYRMKGAVTSFNDCNELNWRFFSPLESIKIQNVKVNISYPTMNKDDILFYGHASSGQLDSLENNKTSFSIDKIRDGDLIECRMVFPTGKINSSDYINAGRLDSVIEDEKAIEHADKRVYRINLYGTIGSYSLVAILIVLTIFIYFHYDKEYKPKFEDEYYRELVNDYGPEVMTYLYNFKEIDNNSLQATIMNLIYKNFIEVDYSDQSTIDKDADYKLVLKEDLTEEQYNNLKSFEKLTLQFLFKKVSSDGHSLRLSELEKFTKSYGNAIEYQGFSKNYTKLVRSEGSKYDFFDKKTEIKCKNIANVFALLAFVSFMLTFIVIFKYSLGLTIAMTVLTGLLAIISNYCKNIQRRSRNGNEEYFKWKAFKKFICEFSNIDDYSIPSVAIMEHYLVYATALGVADLVEKQLDIKLKNANMDRETYFNVYGGSYYGSLRYFRGYYFRRSIYRSMNTMSTTSRQTIAQYRASNVSSGGGSGGFGGGSSFGGGGGGMRGR